MGTLAITFDGTDGAAGAPEVGAEVGKRNPLSASCMLVSVTIRGWSGRRQDKSAAAAIAAQFGNERRMANAVKYLIAPEAFAEVEKAGGRLYQWARTLTLPWLDGGTRILSAKAFFRFQAEYAPLRDAYEAAADRFAADYPRHFGDAQRALGGLFNAREYPRPADVRRRFGADLTILPMPEAADFRVEGIGAAAEAEVRERLANLPKQVEDGARAEVAKRVKDVAESMVDRMASYTGKKDGAFRDSLVQNIRDLADILPALNVADDPWVSDLERRLTALGRVEAEDLRKSRDLRKQTEAEARAILDTVGDYLG